MMCSKFKAGAIVAAGIAMAFAAGGAASAAAAKPASKSPSATAAARKAPAKRSFTWTVEGVNITGVWVVDGYVASANPTEKKVMKTMEGQDLPLQAWSEKIYKQRQDDDRAGRGFANTNAFCLPGGMPQMMIGAAFPIQIMQTPGLIATLHEEQHVHRQIFLNQPHDPDPNPGYLGDSVGHWEGDTLVVDTIGRNDKTTLDMLGLPHSDALHIVEHIRRLSRDKLENVITIDDPKTFTRPFNIRRTYSLQPPDVHPLEYFCLDGQRNTPDPATGNPTFPGADGTAPKPLMPATRPG